MLPRTMPQPIPHSIAPAETLIRGILHPYFYSESKRRLKPEAFLPGPSKRDVSVLRLAYTDAHSCKQHCMGLRMGTDGHYVGMAALVANTIEQASALPQVSGVVTVEATPLDADLQPIVAEVISTEDAGLPMHADILYREPMLKGVPNPAAQQAARYLLSRASYYADPQPTTEGWTGSALQAPVAA